MKRNKGLLMIVETHPEDPLNQNLLHSYCDKLLHWFVLRVDYRFQKQALFTCEQLAFVEFEAFLLFHSLLLLRFTGLEELEQLCHISEVVLELVSQEHDEILIHIELHQAYPHSNVIHISQPLLLLHL